MEAREYIYTVGCKINLRLCVGERLPNGYHNVETILYPISNPCDTLTIVEFQEKIPFSVESNCKELEQKSILHITYASLMKYCKDNRIRIPLSHKVILDKGIPIGAGLGGGSADAGCLLSYFSHRFPQIFSRSLLHEIAHTIGADVPFFLYNKPMLAQGIGSILQETDISLTGMFCLIVEFSHKIDTGKAYEDLDIFRKNYKNYLTVKNNYSKRYSRLALMSNDFEEMVFQSYPSMRQCKEILLTCGVVIAGVSGTGSSMFGIFRTKEERTEAAVSVQNIVKVLYLSDL